MGCLENFLSIDFFSLNVNLRFQHQSKHQTQAGILASYLILILCLSAIYFFGRDIVQQLEPDVSSSQRGVSNPYPMDLGKNKIPLIFALASADSWESFLDPQIYRVDVFLIKGIRDPTTREFNYTVSVETPEECNIQKHFSPQEKPPSNLIKNKYCLKDSVQLQNALSGNFLNSDLHNFVQIRVSRCQNQECLQKEIIDQRLKRLIFIIQAPNYFIDPQNLENPFDQYYKTIYTTVLSKNSKLLSIDFMQAWLYTDDSPLFQKWDIQSKFLMKDPVEYLTEQEQGSSTLLEVNFNSGTEEVFYYRRYKKVQNVMAEVGGFIKVLILVMMFLLKPFIKMHFFTNLLNSVFKFKFNQIENSHQLEDDEHQLKNALTDIHHQKLQEKLASHLFHRQHSMDESMKGQGQKLMFMQSNQKNYNTRLTRDLNKIEIVQKDDEKNKIVIKKYQYCLNFLPFYKHKEKKQLKEAQNLILEKIDISFIVTKLVQLEQLKYVLFTQNQLQLFDFVPKPRINLEEEYDNNIMGSDSHFYNQLFQIQKPVHMKMVDAFDAYHDLTQNREIENNQENQKLLTLIDPVLLQIFEQSQIFLKQDAPLDVADNVSPQVEGEILKEIKEGPPKNFQVFTVDNQIQEQQHENNNGSQFQIQRSATQRKVEENLVEEFENNSDRASHRMDNVLLNSVNTIINNQFKN